MRKPSSTNATSTARLHKLERLLLDCDVNVELEPLLKAVGFRTEFAQRVDVNERNDTDILKYARRHRYIMVCHDKFKDKRTRLELYPEIYKNGGKIIQIGGGPEQEPLSALGRLLVHREDWGRWFKYNDGIVTVHKTGMNTKDSGELLSKVQGSFPFAEDPVKTIKARKQKNLPTKRRPRKHTPDQKPLL